jgi:hypothetical protein
MQARGARQRLKTRQVVRDLPNFRDHGRTVDRPLLALLANLQRRHGKAWASEAQLRAMTFEDVEHMPGVSTLPKALNRLEAQGLLFQQHLLPGGILPDGSPCTHGTRLIWLAANRHSKRAIRVRARCERVTNRVSLKQGEKNVAALLMNERKQVLPTEGLRLADRQRRADEERERQLAEARAHPELWDDSS